MHVLRARKASEDTIHLQSRLDLVWAISLAVLNLLILFVCWKIQGTQADESTYIYGALQMLKGKAIYRDFWVFYPPGIFFVTVAAFSVFGKSLFAVRLALMLAASLSTAVLYLLGRRFMPKAPSVLASALFIMLGVNLWPVAGHHWHSTFALIFCAYFIVRFLDRPRNAYLALAGLFAGATMLFQLHKGAPLVAGVILILLIKSFRDKEELRSTTLVFAKSSLILLMFSVLPLIAAAIYLLKYGILREAVGAVIIFPFTQMMGVSNPDYGVSYGAYTVEQLNSLIRFFEIPALSSMSVRIAASIITVAAPLSVLLVPVVLFLRRKEESRVGFEIPVFVAIASLASLAASLSRPDFQHLLTSVPLSYMLLVFVVFSTVPASLNGKSFDPRKIMRAILFLVIFIPACLVCMGSILLGARVEIRYVNSPLGFVSVISEKGVARSGITPLESLITTVKLNTTPDERILSMPSSAFVYYLTERESVTRFPMLLSSMRNPRQMREIIDDLEQDRTRIIVLDPAAFWEVYKKALPYADEKEYRENLLLLYIREHYRKVGEYGGFAVMERYEPPSL